MSFIKFPHLFAVSLFVSSAIATFASDQNIPQPKQAQKSRVFHSGASSANTPHDRFTKPLTPEEVKSGNVPHMMPPLKQKPNKPIPDAPIGHNKPHQATSATHHDTKCPPDAQKGWIITEGGKRYMLLEDGTKIDLDHPGHGAHAPTHEPPSHDVVHEETEDERNLKRNPLLTPEEEKLRDEIEKHGIGSLYDRNGSKEFGKELNGKVYFKATSGVKGYKPGLWVEDPNVKPKGLKDVPKTGKRPTINLPKSKPEPVKKPEPIQPGAVGLTVRTNTAQTNPKTGQVEMEQGKANVAQTGLTKGQAPKVDVPSVTSEPATTGTGGQIG